MAQIDSRLRFFWVIKAMRIKKLFNYLQDRMILPLVFLIIERKRKQSLLNPKLLESINQDHIYLLEQIYLGNIVRILRLIFQMMFVAYFIGSYWYVFAHTVYLFKIGDADRNLQDISGTDIFDSIIDSSLMEYSSFVDKIGSWDILDFSDQKRAIVASYFAFTTLSTTGFGDYYPVSNIERVVGSFVLLFGIATFSYIMGQLQ